MRRCSEDTLRVLRQNKESLLTIIEVRSSLSMLHWQNPQKLTACASMCTSATMYGVTPVPAETLNDLVPILPA